MVSRIVMYAVVGSISMLIAANAAFNTVGVLGLQSTALVFLGGVGVGASGVGLYHHTRQLRRRSARRF